MDGCDYVAVVRLSTKADETLADVGETCDRIGVDSLPWLLEQGLIRPSAERIAAEETARREAEESN